MSIQEIDGKLSSYPFICLGNKLTTVCLITLFAANLLEYLNNEIKKKLPHLEKKKVQFYQDSAQSDNFIIAMAKISELK